VAHQKRLLELCQTIKEVLPRDIVEELLGDGEGATRQRNLRYSLLIDLRQIGGEIMRDMGCRGWRTDRDDARRFRHVRRRGKHRRPAQAMADQQRRRGVILSQIIGCRDKILNVGREIGSSRSHLAAADPGEVEPQHCNTPSGKSIGDSRCRKGVLATGEAVREQRKRARLDRQIKTSRKIAPRRTGKLDLPRFDPVPLLVRSRFVAPPTP
jgi:hypothetical protein